jgi:hypothetical protein
MDLIQKVLLGLMIQYYDPLEKSEIRVIKNPPGFSPGFMKISDNVCKVKFVNE